MKYSSELVVFIEVARLGSFAEAARSLNLPTTTISRKIQLLETELDVRLFNRTTRSLSLSEVGERLLPRAKLVVDTVRELKDEATFHKANPVGTLHISAPATVFYLLAPLFSAFSAKYSSIKLEFDSSSRTKDLTAERADFALRLGPLNDSSLIALPISRLNYSLVAHKQLVENQPLIKTPEDLLKWPSILNHNDGLILPWRFMVQGESIDLTMDHSLLLDDLLISVQMALQGAGVAYLPTGLVQQHIDEGKLISLCKEWIPQGRELYLVYPDKQHLPSKSKEFIHFIKSKGKEITVLLNGKSV
ncbi:LysR family transcriptional regulator [Vibrio rarus]|uniref:LysR family transcriptional regulator n=1 Tax=Vibrio rarus TaxID=413403 RepID=UPI0021C32C6E|nr:LysR family transcriptional regulator [Vibrio rarus]